MDYKFRTDEINNSSSSSSSSDHNYFTQQALRAGYLRSDIGGGGGGGGGVGDFMCNSDAVREAVLREMEKERIREEIIASEFRKRELEAEVRRELAIERDLMLRRAEGFSKVATMPAPSMWSESRLPPFMHRAEGMRLEERRTMPSLSGVAPEMGAFERLPLERISTPPVPGVRPKTEPFDRLPFQRRVETARTAEVKVVDSGKVGEGKLLPEASKGRKVLFLAKPSPSLAGTKRNATFVGISDLAISSSKKKVQKEWNCALCQVTATCERSLNQHLKGKKHKAKQEEMQTNKVTGNSPRSAAPSAHKVEKVTKKQQVKKNGGPLEKKLKVTNLKRNFKFWCEQCQTGCHSEIVMAAHQKGKKHQLRLQGQNKRGGTVAATTVEASLGKTNETDVVNEEMKEQVNEAAEETELESAETAMEAEAEKVIEEEVKPAEVIDRQSVEEAPVEGSTRME